MNGKRLLATEHSEIILKEIKRQPPKPHPHPNKEEVAGGGGGRGYRYCECVPNRRGVGNANKRSSLFTLLTSLAVKLFFGKCHNQ